MPSSIHKLSNLASGHSFELEVPTGSDVAGAAKAYLVEHEIDEALQGGFYVSVFPSGMIDTESDSDAVDSTTGSSGRSQKVANPPSNLDSSPTGNVI